jgi:hypothetical protein
LARGEPYESNDAGQPEDSNTKACKQLPSLAAEHCSWGFPTDDELRWLLRQGVNENALWPISGATVRFDGSTFDLDQNGVRAVIFRCYDHGEVIDIAAWSARTGQLASWRGQAFCLGDVDDIFNPATYFAGGALYVHETWRSVKAS